MPRHGVVGIAPIKTASARNSKTVHTCAARHPCRLLLATRTERVQSPHRTRVPTFWPRRAKQGGGKHRLFAMPRTPPRRAKASPDAMSADTSALATSVAAKTKSSNAGASASSILRCSCTACPKGPLLLPATRLAKQPQQQLVRVGHAGATAAPRRLRSGDGGQGPSMHAMCPHCRARALQRLGAGELWKVHPPLPSCRLVPACAQREIGIQTLHPGSLRPMCGDMDWFDRPHPAAAPNHPVRRLLRAPAGSSRPRAPR